MGKFTANERRIMNSAITVLFKSEDTPISLEKVKVLREKVNSQTLKTVEELDISDLKSLVYKLMRDGAEVQGCEVEDFCLDSYGLEW